MIVDLQAQLAALRAAEEKSLRPDVYRNETIEAARRVFEECASERDRLANELLPSERWLTPDDVIQSGDALREDGSWMPMDLYAGQWVMGGSMMRMAKGSIYRVHSKATS